MHEPMKSIQQTQCVSQSSEAEVSGGALYQAKVHSLTKRLDTGRARHVQGDRAKVLCRLHDKRSVIQYARFIRDLFAFAMLRRSFCGARWSTPPGIPRQKTSDHQCTSTCSSLRRPHEPTSAPCDPRHRASQKHLAIDHSLLSQRGHSALLPERYLSLLACLRSWQ